MARQRRIEYEGAIYHVMARGDRREDIVKDDVDRERFEETLREVVERSGWVLFGWVLMGNHYHFLFKTPEANLVAGMTWFQATWTSRFNHRHRLWGHLFGGRYKAIPVEDGDYLTRLIHYIHLNPVRAGLVKQQDGLESYRWSSLSDYLKPKRKRRSWVDVERGMEEEEEEWGKMRKGDWRKGVVAGMIRERSLVDNGWLAERLHMGARNAVSRTIKEAREKTMKDRGMKSLVRKCEKMSNSLS
jgi:REP element-mobilizing transposase RayT